MALDLRFSTQRYYRIAVSTFFFIQGLTFASWTSRIPDIKNMLNLSDAALGGVLFSMPVGQLLGMILSGYLVSKFGSKVVLVAAAILYPVTLVTLGLTYAVWQLTLGLFFFGIFGNICNIAVNTQGVGVERIYRRSIMASFHGVWSLAGFVAGLISTLFAGNSISPAYHFCIILSINTILLIIARKSILPRDAHHNAMRDQPIFVKPDAYIMYLGIIAFGSMICEGTMFNWSSIYYERVIGLPKELIRVGYIAFMSTMATGRFTADWMVTRFGVTRILKVAGIIISSGLLIIVIFPHLVTATIGALLVGIGTSSVVPMCYGLAGKSKKMAPGIAVATVSSIGFMGFLLGPPAIGFIAETLNLRWSFTLVAILGLTTTLMATKINKVQ
jgi:MFS family permease